MDAAVGGTDKLSATNAIVTVRTFTLIEPNTEFTYDARMKAVKNGNTFGTYGPPKENSYTLNPINPKVCIFYHTTA